MSYIKAKLSVLPRLFQPAIDSLSPLSGIPFTYRWRVLLLQPISLLAALLTSPAWLFNNRYTVTYVPTRNGFSRCLVFQPRDPSATSSSRPGEVIKRPLHIDIHGGGFLGGIPEYDARFCTYLADKTGAVVISISHRVAPRHVFPAAHDDIDDVVIYLLDHAAEFGADPACLTMGGSSAGGNLSLGASQHLHSRGLRVPLAWVGFCPLVDVRMKPEEKPPPPNFPKSDPLSFLLPLYDAYGGVEREKHREDSRLHPILAPRESLPEKMFFALAGIDILLHEQLSLVERLRKEIDEDGVNDGPVVETMVIENGFHGFLELPSFVLEKERMRVFNRAVEFIRQVHKDNKF